MLDITRLPKLAERVLSRPVTKSMPGFHGGKLAWVPYGRRSQPTPPRSSRPSLHERREELPWRSACKREQILGVEHLIDGDGVGSDGIRPEVEDRDAVVSAGSAAQPHDEA